jgi:hypothetical protein
MQEVAVVVPIMEQLVLADLVVADKDHNKVTQIRQLLEHQTLVVAVAGVADLVLLA